MAKEKGLKGTVPTENKYIELSKKLDLLSEMFDSVEKKAQEMYLWRMEVSQDLTAKDSLDVLLYRWAEILQGEYNPQLCCLGGLGNKDKNKWLVYAVSGDLVSINDYKKIAKVCASAVKTLWVPEITELIQNGFGISRFWVNGKDEAEIKYGINEFIGDFEKDKTALTKIQPTGLDGYLALNWFEFLFYTAMTCQSPIRYFHNIKIVKDWEECVIKYKKIENSLYDASKLALKLLHSKLSPKPKPASDGKANKKLKEPSKEDCKIYLLATTMGENQTNTAATISRGLKKPVEQYQVSRAMSKVRKWLNACELPQEQALGRIREISVDPAKIELGKRTDGKRHGDPVTNRLKDEDDPYED